MAQPNDTNFVILYSDWNYNFLRSAEQLLGTDFLTSDPGFVYSGSFPSEVWSLRPVLTRPHQLWKYKSIIFIILKYQ